MAVSSAGTPYDPAFRHSFPPYPFQAATDLTESLHKKPLPQRTIAQRLLRFWPYFQSAKAGIVLAASCCVVGALTEPLIPALLKTLLDRGFAQGNIALWMVPVALMGLFGIRGLAGFLAQYALSHTASLGLLNLRRAMFVKLNDAQMTLFARQSASKLSNTLVYEVQTGSQMLVSAFLTLAKDSLTVLALMGYLVYLNWKLTLIVLAVFPGLILIMRVLTRRLYQLTKDSQQATDELAYVVEENVLAWRIVRLHDAEPAQTGRVRGAGGLLRRRLM